jgi:flavin-dependent dehydrogenase
MGAKAEELGVEIYPGFAASEMVRRRRIFNVVLRSKVE